MASRGVSIHSTLLATLSVFVSSTPGNRHVLAPATFALVFGARVTVTGACSFACLRIGEWCEQAPLVRLAQIRGARIAVVARMRFGDAA